MQARDQHFQEDQNCLKKVVLIDPDMNIIIIFIFIFYNNKYRLQYNNKQQYKYYDIKFLYRFLQVKYVLG